MKTSLTLIALAIILAFSAANGTVYGLLWWIGIVAAFLAGRAWQRTSCKVDRLADLSVPFSATEPQPNVRRVA